MSSRGVSVAIGAIGLCSGFVIAGNLTPPAGSPAGTMKTLNEVEPRIAINATNTPGDADSLFRIVTPGSYYLTSDISGVPGFRGIEIATNNVSIDLMGFTLQGKPGTLEGIATWDAARDGIIVRNGIIRDWGAAGVLLTTFGAGEGYALTDLLSLNNGGIGLDAGVGSTVRNCVAIGNASIGIRARSYSVIEGCTARDNGSTGIDGSENLSVRGCVASINGFFGISVGSGSTIAECAAYDNADSGFECGNTTTIVNCTSYTNQGIGFDVRGLGCLIISNTATNNNAAGVRLISDACRVEGNNFTDNAIGIEVTSTSNFIVGNTARDNTSNYEIAANNKVGVIVAAPVSPAISGATGGAGVGTTDPWANFSY